MKKLYLFGATFAIFVNANAQSMNENFEAYTAGTYMGNNSAAWSTWSGTVGGTEDTQVSTAQASDGTKSIYFVGSTAGGGPQDVVVDFGGQYNTGQFLFESNFYVVAGKGAYFNFQANTIVGQVWSLNVQMVQTGDMIIDDGAGNFISTSYPTATWFTLTVDVNLNTNDWEIFIDGVSQGVLQTATNQIASIDIYPVNANYGGNNNSGFYIDEFSYLHTPYVLTARNGAVTGINNVNGMATQSVFPSVVVRNLGTANITSFDLEIDYNGIQIVENVTGVNIASLASYTVDFTNAMVLVGGANAVTATISNVNGLGADLDASDDVKVKNIDPVVPAPGKMVVAEEGTGTWCQWCPRGAVFMDQMSTDYPNHFIGIAVHNGDPMTVTNYDAAMAGLIGGYPSAVVDRLPEIDPSVIEADFLSEIVIAPKAVISVDHVYNSLTGIMTVTVTADFDQAISGDYRLACVVTEDDVTGTGAAWKQSNAYAGGGAGIMGGFELLPNPVPASQMHYDHVARIILPDFDGQINSFPSSVAAGEVHSLNFDVTIPATWDLTQLHIIGLLIDPSGDIDNAGTETFYASVDENTSTSSFKIYPNPATDMATIDLGVIENEVVSIQIVDMNGRIVGDRNYGELNGQISLPIATAVLGTGVYIVRVNVGQTLSTSRLVVE